MTESVPPAEASGPDHTNETPENLMDRLQREVRETLGLDLDVPPRIVDLSDDATGQKKTT